MGGRAGASPFPASRPAGHVGALDFPFDQTADGRVVKRLKVVDEYTREALAILVGRRIDADATVDTLERIVADRCRHHTGWPPPWSAAVGVSPRTAVEVLGHSQISRTMNVYTHVTPELSRDAIEQVSAALWATS